MRIQLYLSENTRFTIFARVAKICIYLAAMLFSGFVSAASFDVPGTDTKLDVGGYVKLDIIHNSRTNGDGNQNNIEFSINGIPLDGTEEGEEGQIIFNGRESRFWIKSSTPLEDGTLKTHLEYDFDTNDGNQVVSNSHHARIRHAYGSYGNWLFGRTWSAFMYLPGLAETNDFGGPMGSTFVRQAQLRYTLPLEGGSVTLSAENPESFIAGVGPVDDDTMPDIVARYSAKSWTAAALVRQLVVDNGAVDESTTAVGFQLGGVLPMANGDKIGGQLNVGAGIGRYNSLAATFDGYIDNAGKLEALETTAGLIYYQHKWSENSRSNIALGYFSSDDPQELAASAANKEGTSIHINYLWNITKRVRHGIELIRGEREVMNGTEGELTRLQWSTRVLF